LQPSLRHVAAPPQITAADIPATPAAATCKANLDAAATQFAAGSIAAVTQIAGATITNYVSPAIKQKAS
jgi:hypothetical protein